MYTISVFIEVSSEEMGKKFLGLREIAIAAGMASADLDEGLGVQVDFEDVGSDPGYRGDRFSPSEPAGADGTFSQAFLVIDEDTRVALPRRLANLCYDACSDEIDEKVAEAMNEEEEYADCY